jgi:hypothetical protein
MPRSMWTVGCKNEGIPYTGLGFPTVYSERQQTTHFCRGLPGWSEIPARFVKHDFGAENSIRFMRIARERMLAAHMA